MPYACCVGCTKFTPMQLSPTFRPLVQTQYFRVGSLFTLALKIRSRYKIYTEFCALKAGFGDEISQI